jgi:hypothetical protein
VECSLFLCCNALDPSPSCLCPLMGSHHPPGGLFSPMEVRTDHLPMCTGPNGTCPSGMVLHIKGYALHGLISDRDHSNVNHISSLILLNTCIKSLIHQLTAQRCYTSLQYKSREKDKVSYWASVYRRRKVPRKTSSKPCEWVVWSGEVQACGCNGGQGCKGVTYGCLCRRRVVPVMDAFFPSPLLPLFLLSFYFFFVFYLRANQGTLPWHGDQS